MTVYVASKERVNYEPVFSSDVKEPSSFHQQEGNEFTFYSPTMFGSGEMRIRNEEVTISVNGVSTQKMFHAALDCRQSCDYLLEILTSRRYCVERLKNILKQDGELD